MLLLFINNIIHSCLKLCTGLNDLTLSIKGAPWFRFFSQGTLEILPSFNIGRSQQQNFPQKLVETSHYAVLRFHYYDVIIGSMASQIISLTIVFSTVYLDTDQRKHQGSVSLAYVRGIHRGLVNSPHKWPVTRKMFPFDDVIMKYLDHKWYVFLVDIDGLERYTQCPYEN